MANAAQVKHDLNKWRIKESDNFSKRVTKAAKLASVNLQRDINGQIEKPTAFTKNAVGFSFNVGKFVTRNRIYIKDVQANYLGHLIDDNSPIKKFVPNSAKFTNAYGNIPGLKNMRNLKTVKQKHNNVSRVILIKTTAKKKDKRLIAVFQKNGKRKKTLGSWSQISTRIESQIRNAVKSSYK
ncbi:hypothetical protein D5R38_18645 [Serratia marcescens]|uniref:hypothetical protein n=1 Tax=Serratia marcescens TaxID=615 RepID=UPI001068B3BE|nr:hypothetical protein [Serratia marcescens]TEW83390.1 hypothetical protein D5R38_18645 [Serratia marcescens]